ncbi:HOG (high osmolarity glycerol) pathway protein [Coemansia aciculifera]|uniref:HOG (High osmolarity glycerol) pathway protein n=2 Tax=Coemansia TaxID=4863 RepID=A0A9W8H3X4_9FUNG|nr:HOG (high osmolarity glycerol) pathway protein [Coemansia pectinata]KAJ2865344.1 HOG (high osmolarity glycerol) pathway protein [Coemansia aciculifera]KAJ2875002.1 HOG (high osmolarity glycerol) pathway protein [Coemansia aciculifera]KAJ2885529.1 HOG (high osmolarity glycerol) pathway protein [Coemansia aciculifera]
MEPDTPKEQPVVRDFAYPTDDPRHEGKYKVIASEEDGDAGSDSDPWSSFESGGPSSLNDEGSNGTTILGKARALYDFEAENPTELAFAENDILYITYKQCDGWLVGYKGNQVGLIPENYVELLDTSEST